MCYSRRRACDEPRDPVSNVPQGHGPFRGVLIDLFGTLVPALPPQMRIPHLLSMAEALGVTPGVFAQDWGSSFAERVTGQLGPLEETIRRIARRQGRDPTDAQVEQALAIRLEFSGSVLSACAPVLPGLDALLREGISLAVVSDTSGETPRLWPTSPLGSRIKATVFSCETGYCKPDPRMYRSGLEQLELAADQCAFVGDGGSRELTGAAACGLSPFLYRFPHPSSDPSARIDPDIDWMEPPLRDLRDLLSLSR